MVIRKIIFRKGFFPEVVAELDFDLIYTSIIDYAMNDEEYVGFGENLIKKIISVSLTTGKHH